MLLWAIIALAICMPIIGMAQGFLEPKKHTRLLTPPGDSNVYDDEIIYSIYVKGNETHYQKDMIWLTSIIGNVKYSGKAWGLSDMKVKVLRPPYDTLSYAGDINWYQSSFYLSTNFDLGKYYVELQITADLDISKAELGDSLSFDINLGMNLNGASPTYYDPEPQVLVFGEKINGLTGVDPINSKKIVYPNPFNDQINLVNFNEKKSITITNALGQIVYLGSTDSTTIETSNFVSGVYFLRTENEVYKLVKN